MSEQSQYETMQFNRAASLIRTNGILSIIFGSIGVVAILFVIAVTNIATYFEPTVTDEDYLGISIMSLVAFVFVFLPHVYFVVAGIFLVKNPEPKVAMTLLIINIVIGTAWNLILLIFGIIGLVQIGDYERGFKKLRPAHHKQ